MCATRNHRRSSQEVVELVEVPEGSLNYHQYVGELLMCLIKNASKRSKTHSKHYSPTVVNTSPASY